MPTIGFTAEHRKSYRVKMEIPLAAGGERNDPYNYVIEGRLGHLFVHGPGLFGVSTNSGKGPFVGKLRRLPFCKIVADASDGANFVFAAEHLKVIARMAKAKRRRQLTPEQRATATARLQEYRLSSESKRPRNAAEQVCDSEAIAA